MERIYRIYLTCPPHEDGFQGWLDEPEILEIPDDSMDEDGPSAVCESPQTSEDESVQSLQPALPLQDVFHEMDEGPLAVRT